jgi:hypothetical protein
MSVGVRARAAAFGRDPTLLVDSKRAVTALIPDDFHHEQATAFVVKDKGLVVDDLLWPQGRG